MYMRRDDFQSINKSINIDIAFICLRLSEERRLGATPWST